jgi:hypothetical protein
MRVVVSYAHEHFEKPEKCNGANNETENPQCNWSAGLNFFLWIVFLRHGCNLHCGWAFSETLPKSDVTGWRLEEWRRDDGCSEGRKSRSAGLGCTENDPCCALQIIEGGRRAWNPRGYLAVLIGIPAALIVKDDVRAVFRSSDFLATHVGSRAFANPVYGDERNDKQEHRGHP